MRTSIYKHIFLFCSCLSATINSQPQFKGTPAPEVPINFIKKLADLEEKFLAERKRNDEIEDELKKLKETVKRNTENLAVSILDSYHGSQWNNGKGTDWDKEAEKVGDTESFQECVELVKNKRPKANGASLNVKNLLEKGAGGCYAEFNITGVNEHKRTRNIYRNVIFSEKLKQELAKKAEIITKKDIDSKFQKMNQDLSKIKVATMVNKGLIPDETWKAVGTTEVYFKYMPEQRYTLAGARQFCENLPNLPASVSANLATIRNDNERMVVNSFDMDSIAWIDVSTEKSNSGRSDWTWGNNGGTVTDSDDFWYPGSPDPEQYKHGLWSGNNGIFNKKDVDRKYGVLCEIRMK